MSLLRPDPDQLLQQLSDDTAKACRGHLKLFFGASAGVGKTCAMLEAAHRLQDAGLPVVIGVVETHGRHDTQALVDGLPRLPLRHVSHRGRTLYEFDLDGALAFGAAHADALVLVDELAHSNAPGSRHPKRWQDVQELLEAGVNIWTTMNVQHLESLNDVVTGIAGIRVWETVPDHVFDHADEVVVLDLPPDELLERLKQGKVYLPQQAQLATQNFFRKGNLLALRELALRRTADRVDSEMQAYRLRSVKGPVWPNRESLLVCVGSGSGAEKVVRSGARLARQLEVSWHAVHVEAVQAHMVDASLPLSVMKALQLAQELGATTATLSAPSVATALVGHAREHNLSRLLLGRPVRRPRWPWQSLLTQAIEIQADELDLIQVALNDLPAARPPQTAELALPDVRWRGYVAAVVACAATALLATPLVHVFELSNIVMLFLLAVIAVALRHGRGPAVLASFVGVGLFDFFFVPPRFSFAVSDFQYLMTFAVMLFVALVIGQLTAGLKVQASAATERERRVRRLYDMSRELSGALVVEQVADIAREFLSQEFGVGSALVVADANNQLQIMRGATAEPDMGVAQWAFDRGEPAGHGTDTLPASPCMVLPLKATMRLRGVLVVLPTDDRLRAPERRRLLDTCASLLAISIERIHYIDVAQESTVQIESERLRNSLLSAISHDLRTPLASLVGIADTLRMTTPAPLPEQDELIEAMRRSALRMNAMVTNLLDMARLQAGALQLDLQWQPLEEVLESALQECADRLVGRAVKVDVPEGFPLLHFDAALIERVLVNLLDNAAKYTPKGTDIHIHARVESLTALLCVDDQGPGLPPSKEAAIFEKFERGQKEGITPGVGMGLAICRAILLAHGGAVLAETRPQGGARFTLTLPRGSPPSLDGLQEKGLP